VILACQLLRSNTIIFPRRRFLHGRGNNAGFTVFSFPLLLSALRIGKQHALADSPYVAAIIRFLIARQQNFTLVSEQIVKASGGIEIVCG
jgi:hypothetical protein